MYSKIIHLGRNNGHLLVTKAQSSTKLHFFVAIIIQAINNSQKLTHFLYHVMFGLWVKHTIQSQYNWQYFIQTNNLIA